MINGDAGLQPQRTALAWTRTGLAILINALLVLRVGVQGSQFIVSALGVALCEVFTGILVIAVAIAGYLGSMKDSDA